MMLLAASVAFLAAAAPFARAAHSVTTNARDGSVDHIGQWYAFTDSVTNCGGQLVQYCNTTGCGFSFTFTGTAIDVTATFDTDRGTIAVDFDGQSQGTVNAWTPTDGEASCNSLFRRDNLANSQHTLKATVASPHDGSSKFEVISMTVTVPDPGDNTGGGGGGGGQQTTTQPPQTTGNGGGGGGGGQQTSNPPPSSSQPSSSRPASNTPSSQSSSQPATNTNTAIIAASTATIRVDDPRIQYSPANAWANSGDISVSSCSADSRVSSTPGASFSFAFKGTAISFGSVPSDQSGLYTITLDGVTSETKNGFSTTSGICLPQTWTRSGLAEGDHVLVVTVAGPSNGTLSKRAGSRFELREMKYYGASTTDTDAYLAANSPPASNNQAAVIGGSVGGVFVAFLIAGVGTYLFLRHRKSQREKERLNGAATANAAAAAGFSNAPGAYGSVIDPRFASPGPVAAGAWSTASPQHSALGISPNRSFSAAGHHQPGAPVFQPAAYAPVPTHEQYDYPRTTPSPGHPFATGLSPGVVEAMYQPSPMSQQSAPSSLGPRSPTSASGRSVPIVGSEDVGHVEAPWAGSTNGTSAPSSDRKGPLPPLVQPMSPPPAYGRTPAPPARGYAQDGTVLL